MRSSPHLVLVVEPTLGERALDMLHACGYDEPSSAQVQDVAAFLAHCAAPRRSAAIDKAKA